MFRFRFVPLAVAAGALLAGGCEYCVRWSWHGPCQRECCPAPCCPAAEPCAPACAPSCAASCCEAPYLGEEGPGLVAPEAGLFPGPEAAVIPAPAVAPIIPPVSPQPLAPQPRLVPQPTVPVDPYTPTGRPRLLGRLDR